MPAKAGGAEGGRTPDLLIANEALSQLSYGPAEVQQSGKCCTGWYVRVIYGATPRSVKGSARSLARGGQCGRFQLAGELGLAAPAPELDTSGALVCRFRRPYN